MFKIKHVLHDGETGGEGSAGGGVDIAAQIKAAVDAATAGLAAKNAQLLSELKADREKLKSFDGVDPVKVKELMAKFDGDEDSKLIAEGKIEELLNRKYEKRDKDWQAKLNAAIAERDAAKGKADKFLQSVLDDRLREAFNGKVEPSSMKAALLEAKLIFKLDDEGRAVQFDEDGNVVLGKDKTPFSPAEWITSDTTRKESPYLFPVTGSGSGATQTGSGKVNVDIMKLSPTERIALARKT